MIFLLHLPRPGRDPAIRTYILRNNSKGNCPRQPFTARSAKPCCSKRIIAPAQDVLQRICLDLGSGFFERKFAELEWLVDVRL
jgi:hypothetical protein